MGVTLLEIRVLGNIKPTKLANVMCKIKVCSLTMDSEHCALLRTNHVLIRLLMALDG